MKAKIDLEKFISSMLGYAEDNCEETMLDYLHSALQDQGLEYKDGEIVEIDSIDTSSPRWAEIVKECKHEALEKGEELRKWLNFENTHEGMSVTIPDNLKGTDPDGGVVGEKGEQGKEPLGQDGFDAELNALLKKYEHLPKHELADILEFYLWVVGKQSIKERLMEGAKPETLEEKVEHWQRMHDIAMKKIKGEFKEEDSTETKAIKEQIENLKKRIEDNQLGCIVQRLDKIIELLQSAILVLPKEPYVPPIIYKRPLDPDPNVLGGWTTTASTFGSDCDIDTDKIKQDETSKPES